MKKILFLALTMCTMAVTIQPAFADGCYICRGNPVSYVKYTGTDNQDKRKAAKNCGCDVGGTRGSCDAANLKVLCTVQTESQDHIKFSQNN